MRLLKAPALLLLSLLTQRLAIAQVPDSAHAIGEVVVKGAGKAVSRGVQIIPTEIITASFFQKNPTPNLLESLSMLNGIRPQLNCSVCNTGDIHINGMEGPYTMVLMDGMPIVSSLSTVYGFSSIPNSIIERLEIVKGPAAAQYSPEAMGGMINIVTKDFGSTPKLYADIWGSSWLESNADLATKLTWHKKISGLLSANYYQFQQRIDNNRDGFTDMPLQQRISAFSKWQVQRPFSRKAELAARYIYEDRWGGQTFWEPYMRGTEIAYAEQISTRRWELIGAYQLPLKEQCMIRLSYNWHDQNSMYGTMPFLAQQQVLFVQSDWEKQVKRHKLMAGCSSRYTHYDDNTVATFAADGSENLPSKRMLSGAFIQDEWQIREQLSSGIGYRIDYDGQHGWIHSPRIAWKYSPSFRHNFRIALGNGFRVVNVFTEDHAALSGARSVVIAESLRPEISRNISANYHLKIPGSDGMASIDLSGFYTHFSNKIIGDFDTDPQKIIYKNLKGDAVSRGLSLNTDYAFSFPLNLAMGISYMDVRTREEYMGRKTEKQQLFAPKWSGNILLGWTVRKKWVFDLTAKWEGPMRLPVVPLDYRPEYAPWRCIANIQVSYKWRKSIHFYGGVKNLFNSVPRDPILRAFDPFDKTAADRISNPNGYTFDPSYSYGSLQGVRGFFGIRYQL